MAQFTVIGARGFIGGFLAARLEQLGHAVAQPRRGDLQSLAESDLGHVFYCLGVDNASQNPYGAFEAHIAHLARILHVCRFASLTYLSSTRLYLGADSSREDAALRILPDDDNAIFNATKIAAEQICFAAAERGVRVVRMSNVVGFAPNGISLVPSLIKTAMRGDAIRLTIARQSAKDYVALDDVLDLLPRIAVAGRQRCYNLASGSNLELHEVVEAIHGKFPCAVEWREDAPAIVFPTMDISRVQAEFSYTPRPPIDALAAVCEEFRRRLVVPLGRLARREGMKPIVVTGARGYVGSALVKRLASEGHALRLVSRAAVAPGHRADADIEYAEADLRNEADWLSLLRDTKAIVHLSSRTDLRAADADPAADADLNVAPVHALARAAARSGTPLPVILASTVTIVGDDHAAPVDESAPDSPGSVYDRHKLECETILREATRRGLLKACILRLSNVYGYGVPSINANRGILNAMMRRAGRGEPLTLYGDGGYVRDFTFIDDAVDAFCRALQCDAAHNGEHYVIATGRGRTLAEAFDLVAREAFRRTGRKVEIRRVPEPSDLHRIERRNFVGDARRFQALTGWRARVDLEAGIRDYFDRAATEPRAGAPHAAA